MKGYGLFGRRERKQASMEREDFLQQIDEFKEKAKQLQGMLANKEFRVRELQDIVAEREGKAQELEEKTKELEEMLRERQEEADGIMGQVEEQLDRMIKDVNRELATFGEKVSADLKASMTDNFEKTNDMLGGLDSISICLDGMDKTLNKATQDFGKLDKSIEEMGKALDRAAHSIEEKIHSENVKCYRNVQTILEEMNKKLVQQEQYEKDMKSLHCMVRCVTWVSIINFVILVGFVLFQLGVF